MKAIRKLSWTQLFGSHKFELKIAKVFCFKDNNNFFNRFHSPKFTPKIKIFTDPFKLFLNIFKNFFVLESIISKLRVQKSNISSEKK